VEGEREAEKRREAPYIGHPAPKGWQSAVGQGACQGLDTDKTPDRTCSL
jgi:hypothetical protein